MTFQPMLAGKLEIKQLPLLQYPLIASRKLDGIRAIVRDGNLLTRTLKNVPNKFVFNALSRFTFEGFDGELIVGEPNHPDVYRTTTSAIMSAEGEPNFTYYVFDHMMHPEKPYVERLLKLHAAVEKLPEALAGRVCILAYDYIGDEEDLVDAEKRYVKEAYEGIMLRCPVQPYLFGRSTINQSALLKLKRFADSECRVLGIEELMINNNEKTKDARGKAKRSSHKENKTAAGIMGSLCVQDMKTGVVFDLGSGFTDADRIYFWENKDHVKGKILKYKYQPVGVKDKPRFPVYLGFRSPSDM